MRQTFEVEASDDRHYGHQQLAFFARRQQGFKHLRRLECQFFRSLQPVGRGLRVMFVTVHAMFGTNFFNKSNAGVMAAPGSAMAENPAPDSRTSRCKGSIPAPNYAALQVILKATKAVTR